MYPITSDPSTLPDQAIDFGQVELAKFLPALGAAIEEAASHIEAIKNQPHPDFKNTIVALEVAGERVSDLGHLFFNLFHAHAQEGMAELAQEISARLAEHSSNILLDSELFSRIKSIFNKLDTLGLNGEINGEERQLVSETYDHFMQNGALLGDSDKALLRDLDQQLSALAPKFSENVLKSTQNFELWVESESDLGGLPKSLKAQAEEQARERGKGSGWLFTLDAPNIVPFLQYCRNRSLRETMWRAYSGRAFLNEYSNREIVLKIVQLRHKRATLLGFNTHAHYVLKKRMASSPETVHSFLNNLLKAYWPAAQQDFIELRNLGVTELGTGEIKPWDISFLSNILKERKIGFHEEDLRAYFKLENVIEGVFTHSSRLFGVSFKEQTSKYSGYHPEVRGFEVSDELSNQYLGLLYLDLFPRATKKEGAWMTQFREQGLWQGKLCRPHVSVVCNFSKPTKDHPSLLTYREVGTLFHEMGHALHSLVSQCRYRSLAGTNVYFDFVELPSQLMENWIHEKEGLTFARHFETGELLPDHWIEKLKANQKFQAGYMGLRQLRFALLDFSWHNQDPQEITDVDQFEQKILKPTELLAHVDGANMSCSFSHIFSGGYSAGYYSYKWAEVLDADAFECFKEQGVYNRKVGEKFRKEILEKGGAEHPMVLYERFRGRKPDYHGLLRREGLGG